MCVEVGGHHPTTSFNPYTPQSIDMLMYGGCTTLFQERSLILNIGSRCFGIRARSINHRPRKRDRHRSRPGPRSSPAAPYIPLIFF